MIGEWHASERASERMRKLANVTTPTTMLSHFYDNGDGGGGGRDDNDGSRGIVPDKQLTYWLWQMLLSGWMLVGRSGTLGLPYLKTSITLMKCSQGCDLPLSFRSSLGIRCLPLTVLPRHPRRSQPSLLLPLPPVSQSEVVRYSGRQQFPACLPAGPPASQDLISIPNLPKATAATIC